jgi:hypothetical protein
MLWQRSNQCCYVMSCVATHINEWNTTLRSDAVGASDADFDASQEAAARYIPHTYTCIHAQTRTDLHSIARTRNANLYGLTWSNSQGALHLHSVLLRYALLRTLTKVPVADTIHLQC